MAQERIDTPKYYCSAASNITSTARIGEVLDRATRPLSAGELARITGLPINVITSFLQRNQTVGRISVRLVPRRDSDSGKPMREYWRGTDCIHHTFGSGDMLSRKQARELAQGHRPIQWRETESTIWSIDETETLAVRRGEQVICMGRVERIAERESGITVTVRNGPRMEFGIKSQ